MFGNVDNIIRRFGYDPNNPNKLPTNRAMPQNQPGYAKVEQARTKAGIKAGTVPVTPLRPNELPPDPARIRMSGNNPIITDPASVRAMGQVNPAVELNPNTARLADPNIGPQRLRPLDYTPAQAAELAALEQRRLTLGEAATTPGAADEIKRVVERQNALKIQRGVPNLTDEAAYLAGQGVNAAGTAAREGIASATNAAREGVNNAREFGADLASRAEAAIRPDPVTSEAPKTSQTPGATEKPGLIKRVGNWFTGRDPNGTSRVSRTAANAAETAADVGRVAADVATELGRGVNPADPSRLTPAQTAELSGGTDLASRRAKGQAERKANKQFREDLKAAKKQSGTTLRAIINNPNATPEQIKIAEKALRSPNRKVVQGVGGLAKDVGRLAKPIAQKSGGLGTGLMIAQTLMDMPTKGVVPALADTGKGLVDYFTKTQWDRTKEYGPLGALKEMGLDAVNMLPEQISLAGKTGAGLLGVGPNARDEKGVLKPRDERVKSEQEQGYFPGLDDFTKWVNGFRSENSGKGSVMDGYKSPTSPGAPNAPLLDGTKPAVAKPLEAKPENLADSKEFKVTGKPVDETAKFEKVAQQQQRSGLQRSVGYTGDEDPLVEQSRKGLESNRANYVDRILGRIALGEGTAVDAEALRALESGSVGRGQTAAMMAQYRNRSANLQEDKFANKISTDEQKRLDGLVEDYLSDDPGKRRKATSLMTGVLEEDPNSPVAKALMSRFASMSQKTDLGMVDDIFVDSANTPFGTTNPDAFGNVQQQDNWILESGLYDDQGRFVGNPDKLPDKEQREQMRAMFNANNQKQRLRQGPGYQDQEAFANALRQQAMARQNQAVRMSRYGNLYGQ